MKSFVSPIFGSIAEPESLEELLGLVAKPVEGESFNVRMWRGQANIEWPIHSGAYRRLTLNGNSIVEFNLSYYEKWLLGKATHQGLRVHDGRLLSDFELLARLQHHGAATRLLDATRNCLVGLYFAAESNPSTYGLLAGFHSSFLGGGEGNPEDRAYQTVIDGIASCSHPQTWDPPVITPRIAAQHSQFLYSALKDDPRGSISIGEADHSLLCLAISPSLKASSLVLLSQLFDIRHSTLFPDIYGFCNVNSARFGEFENERW